MILKLKGVLLTYGEVEEFGYNPTMRKRQIVLQTYGQYPQPVAFDLLMHNVDLVINIPLLSDIEITARIKGKLWKNKKEKIKYINNYICYKIEVLKLN